MSINLFPPSLLSDPAQYERLNIHPTLPRDNSMKSYCYWRLPSENPAYNQISLEKFGYSVYRAFRTYQRQFPQFSGRDMEEIARLFCGQFFLEGDSITVNFANVSLKDTSEKRIALSIRIPSHPAFLALGEHITVAVVGYCPTSAKNPIFIPERVLLTHNQDQADYEKSSDVLFSQLTEDQWPDRAKQNLLTAEFSRGLPKFAIKTKERLGNWLEFLDFKEKLIKHKTQGIRYLKWELKEESNQLQFFVIAENEQMIKRICGAFRRQNLHAFKEDVSLESYRFVLPKNNLERLNSAFDNFGQLINNGIQVIQNNHSDKELVKACNAYRELLRGEAKAGGESSKKKKSANFDYDKAVFALLSVELSEELSNKINGYADDDIDETSEESNKKSKTRQEKIENLFKHLPESGFLSISLVGYMVLIERHRRAVNNLMQNESCYAPYLSSYLFDITSANQPYDIPDIIEWENPNLNPAQKSAVQKMLAAPDICLIQGPPGTGKTTVIAEACLQFAKRGETVLLASQAHDALDNALSRLQNNPSLRAIRLAKNTDRITEEGKSFTGESVLAKQYSALSYYVKREYLTPLESLQNEIDVLSQWINQAQFIEDDLCHLRERYKRSTTLIQQESENLNELQSAFERQNQVYLQAEQTRQEQVNLLNYLQTGQGSLNVLTIPLSDQLYPLVDTLLTLQALNIKQNFTKSMFLAEPENQAAILGSLFGQWQKVVHALPKMQADYDNLLLNKGGVDTQTILKIEQLKQEIAQLADKMEESDDDKIANHWRAKRRELKELENGSSQNGKLNGDYYELFSDEMMFTQNDDIEAVKKQLRLRIAQVQKAQSELQPIIEKSIQALQHLLAQPKLIVPSDEAVKEKESEIAQYQNELDQIKEQGRQKREEAQLVVAELGKEGELTAVLNEEKVRLEALQTQFTELSQQNRDFQPLFERWKDMLVNYEERAERDWQYVEKAYIESCNVVAISCNENEYTLTRNDFDSFDVVIIDEVSKATPLELLLPLMRARKAILVGDHRQLPPIFNEADGVDTFEDEVEKNEAEQEQDGGSNSDLTRENLYKFEKMVTASLFKELFEQAPDSLRERLTVQFRMHPEIMRLINFFYEGKLECGNTEVERPHGLTFQANGERLLGKNDHILWIDTTDDEKGNRYKIGDKNTNVLEARLIAKTLLDMDRQLSESGEYHKKNKLKVGVVSFYQPQCRVIRDEIRKLVGKKKPWFDAIDVEINTVIRYQGKEKPIILLSLVKNNGGDLKQKFHAGRANIARFEFINVAMSRAQNLLMVFGARNMLENREVRLPRMDRSGFDKKMVYKKMFNYLEHQAEHGAIFEAKRFSKVLTFNI